jgi:acyl-CoA thioesterase FadM
MRRIWQEQFVPLVFDLDVRGEVTPGALCRYFAVAAGHHATELNLGDEVLRPKGLAWMLHRLEMQFLKPAQGESPVTVETWPSERSGRLRAERDFTITGQGGELLAAGLSTWLLIQLAARRPARMPAAVLDVAVKGRPAPFEASGSDEEAFAASQVQWKIPVNWMDLDINGHATFARLVEWALGAAPHSRWTTNRLEAMVLRFEQEALPGEELTARFDLADADGKCFHVLTKDDGAVAVRGCTTWRAI